MCVYVSQAGAISAFALIIYNNMEKYVNSMCLLFMTSFLSQSISYVAIYFCLYILSSIINHPSYCILCVYVCLSQMCFSLLCLNLSCARSIAYLVHDGTLRARCWIIVVLRDFFLQDYEVFIQPKPTKQTNKPQTSTLHIYTPLQSNTLSL